MSAVAYYFAKAIVEKENIPVGIINLSIGGAPIETFISKEALRRNEKFASKVSGNWLENESLPEWIRQRGKENVGNNANGFKDDLGLNHAYKPGFAYACGIEPLLAFSIKGIIWYQGESNSLEKEKVEEYRALLHLMIGDYRIKWKQPDMPFYWVQLSSIDTANYQSKLWPPLLRVFACRRLWLVCPASGVEIIKMLNGYAEIKCHLTIAIAFINEPYQLSHHGNCHL